MFCEFPNSTLGRFFDTKSQFYKVYLQFHNECTSAEQRRAERSAAWVRLLSAHDSHLKFKFNRQQ